ncbi:hypothetical protein [Nitratiruptor sp. YY09-18]|uniref:hypothetical protein n=1 Tax=Nitratiruptor sp. YY09-18 TaxID=2724901 RepID=UPI001916641D|nr:hypothetical protein [Nitratiruptor sp. YY09-18]BCD68500.1 hypothetical protein NitYY0918_C1416 [Nitratiruptor sp. YY09-18]
MNKLSLFPLFPAVLAAGNLTFGLHFDHEISYYFVEDKQRHLKSKLEFPKNVTSLAIRYDQTIQNFSYSFGTNIVLDSKTQKGKDFDWQDNRLAVFSSSFNKITKYRHYHFDLAYKVNNHAALFGRVKYKKILQEWHNTTQTNYFKNSFIKVDGKSLAFEEKRYQYHLGVKYHENVANNITFSLTPSLVFAQVKTKDYHILRNFYVTQHPKCFGYSLQGGLQYRITKKSAMLLFTSYTYMQDKNTPMHYFSDFSKKLFLRLPSSYTNKSLNFGFSYSISF